MLNIKNILIGIAITILTVFVVIYGIQTFYPAPEYDDFCDTQARIPLKPIPENPELLGGTCSTVSPDSRDECCINKGYEYYDIETGTCIGTFCTKDAKQCDDGSVVGRDPNEGCQFYPCPGQLTCYDQYDKVHEAYSKNLFIITLIIGIILIAIGALLFQLEAVGSGIMGGGIITLLWGSGQYWRYAEDLFRFIISIIGLLLVIGLGYWVNSRDKKK